jgi:hypothetical protein
MGLVKRPFNAGNIADAESDCDAIESAIGIGQLFGIALLKRDDAVESTRCGAFAPHLEHIGVDVANGCANAVAARIDDAKGNITGAAGKIEHMEIPLAFGRIDRRHQRVFPRAVQAARHQVIHEVVATGDRMKHLVDAPLLVLEWHALIAEMSLFAARGHSR